MVAIVGLKMAYASKRSDSSNLQFRQRVPADVRDRVCGRRIVIPFPSTGREPLFTVETTIGTTVKFSLRTSDPNTYEARALVLGPICRRSMRPPGERSRSG
jgi:hypothetical protein